MATLATDFLGIKSPNPFWLASGPPTDKEYNVRRGFEAGWGGVVWKWCRARNRRGGASCGRSRRRAPTA